MIALPSLALPTLPDPSTPLGMLYLVVGTLGLIMFVLGVILALVVPRRMQRRIRSLEHALAYLLTRPSTRAERRLVAELMESEPRERAP